MTGQAKAVPRRLWPVLLVGLLAVDLAPARPARADAIVLPAGALARQGTVGAVYRLDRPATGSGHLTIDWTDAYGREVERRRLAFRLDGGRDVAFPLDLRRAVAMQNRLQARLVFDGEAGGKESSRQTAAASFIAAPPPDPWSDYQIIMWQWRTAAEYRALRQIGVSAGEAHVPYRDAPARGLDAEIAPMLQSDLRWYVENIATDFYSAYHRWFPDHPPDWRFLALQKRYRENPTDPTLFRRDPSLSDPAWLARIRSRLAGTVKAHAPYRPLYYNLGDETGIADLTAAWDFDFSPASLAGFRQWLRGQYRTLAALDRQWGARFGDWDAVMPMTTAQALARTDGNFSAWADFKAWMDIAFAGALQAGSDAVHAADPAALAAIEGGQIPGTGGYDYALLAPAVDAIELSDEGDNMEIARSLKPGLVMLNTSTEAGPGEWRTTWRELLRGSRGVVLWDDKNSFANEDGALEARGHAAAPLFRELRSGLGALVINSSRHVDPIALLYSPASFRTRWLIDNQPLGDAWSRREIGAETGSNLLRASIDRFARSIEHIGLQHRFVTPAQLLDGGLAAYRVLILPQAIALAPAAAAAIRRFAEAGGVVVADGEPGQFDEHSRRQPRPLLADLFPPGPATERTIGKGKAIRVGPGAADRTEGAADPALMRTLAGIFAAAGVKADYAVVTPGGKAVTDIECYEFENGGVRILALLRDASGSAGAEDAVLRLPRQTYIYDLRAHRSLGETDRLDLTVTAGAPRLLALAGRALPAPTVAMPPRAQLGETVALQIGFAGAPVAARSVLRVDVTDPDGRVVPYYGGTRRLQGANASLFLPLALNDPAGAWTVAVSDVLSGQTATTTLAVAAAQAAGR